MKVRWANDYASLLSVKEFLWGVKTTIRSAHSHNGSSNTAKTVYADNTIYCIVLLPGAHFIDFFHHNFNFMESLCCCSSILHIPQHGSDPFIRLSIGSNCDFHWIWIVIENSFMKRTPGACLNLKMPSYQYKNAHDHGYLIFIIGTPILRPNNYQNGFEN